MFGRAVKKDESQYITTLPGLEEESSHSSHIAIIVKASRSGEFKLSLQCFVDLTLWEGVFELLPLVALAVGGPVEEDVVASPGDGDGERGGLGPYGVAQHGRDQAAVLSRQDGGLQKRKKKKEV